MRHLAYLYYRVRLRADLNRDTLRVAALVTFAGAVIVTVIAVLATLRLP